MYTGHDSKVMMNSTNSNIKLSKIEKSSNRYILYTILVQCILSLQSAIFTSIWTFQHSDDSYWYLDLTNNIDYNLSSWVNLPIQILINFGKWFMALMNFVSIGLLVSLEMVKFV